MPNHLDIDGVREVATDALYNHPAVRWVFLRSADASHEIIMQDGRVFEMHIREAAPMPK